MNIRISKQQKAEKVQHILVRSGRSMSAWEIGREMGYAGGTPVREVLNALVDLDVLRSVSLPHRLGRAVYYRMNVVYAKQHQLMLF